MKNIDVGVLKPGLVFTEPVYIDDNKNLFIPAGIAVREKDIDKLKTLGITAVQTDGDIAPEGTETAAAYTPLHTGSALSLSDVQNNKAAYRTYLSFIERTNMVLLKISSGTVDGDYRMITGIGAQLLQAMRTQREQFIGFILGGEVQGFEMAKNAVNTAILSALIAGELKYPHHKILNIIIGGLLHDSGMLRLPKEITEKKGGLSDAERRKIRSHPLLTHKIVIKEFSYTDDIGHIVLQHHERWNGEGYPARIAGEVIDPGARIVSIADAFEAMVSPKPYRGSISGYQAIKNLLSDNSHRFDPNMLKIFVAAMGIYPIGSIVCLNNGAAGRVLENRPTALLRPKIQVIFDDRKKLCTNEQAVFIDLLVDKHLYITQAIDRKKLMELYE